MTSFPPGPVDGSHIFDDFHANASVSTGLIGKLNWDMTTIGNASTPSWVGSPNGILRLTTASSADGDGAALTLEDDMLVLAGTNQVFRCRVRYPVEIASNNFRIGFLDVLTSGEPEVGVWINSDGGLLSFDCANADTDKTKAITGIPTLTSGTTMVVATWHDLELQMSGENSNGGPDTISCFVDGFAAGQITGLKITSAEVMAFAITHWQDSGGTDAMAFDIDYYEAYLPRN